MPDTTRRDHIDTLGAVTLITFNMLLGLNQAMVKLVNAGFSPVFQTGLRSLCAFVLVLAAAWWLKRRLSLTDGSLVQLVAFGSGFVWGSALLQM